MVIEKLFAKVKANSNISIVLPHGELKLADDQPNKNDKFIYELKEVESKGNVLNITPLTNTSNLEFMDLTLERRGCRVRLVLDDFYIVDENSTIIGVLIGHGLKNIGFGDGLKAIYTSKPRMDLIGLTYDSQLVNTVEAEERGE